MAAERGISVWQATKLWRRRVVKKLAEASKPVPLVPTPTEFYNKRNWTRVNLLKWGVGWPPRSGWKAKLERKVLREGKNNYGAEIKAYLGRGEFIGSQKENGSDAEQQDARQVYAGEIKGSGVRGARAARGRIHHRLRRPDTA
jgi:hypothetical protein